MQTKLGLSRLRGVLFFLFLLCLSLNCFAHSPDLSSIIIYEQNGKHFLAIKSSLTAFEGEIDYHFKKNAYNTPEEFQQLVSKYFQKKCLLMMNNDTIKFFQPAVILGHETTVFAELQNVPAQISSCYLKNGLFSDLPKNQCELILALRGYPQKQYILNKENLNEVNLLMENSTWTVMQNANFFSKTSNQIIFWLVSIAVVAIFVMLIRKNTS